MQKQGQTSVLRSPDTHLNLRYPKPALSVKIRYQNLHLRRRKKKNEKALRCENKLTSIGNQKFTGMVSFLPLIFVL